MPKYYLIPVFGCVEPELAGPYASEHERMQAAHVINDEQDRETDGLFWLDIDDNGEPSVGAWCGGTFDDVIRFKVASVSENINSFGLRGMILISECGQAWQAAANAINLKQQGEILTIPAEGDVGTHLAGFGFEIPEQLPNPPQGVVDEVWGEPT